MPEKINPLTNLTDKEEIFVEEYIKHGNASKAADVAGYKWSNRVGPRTLKNSRVKAAIANKKLDMKADAVERIDSNWVLKQAVEVYNRSMARKPVTTRDPKTRKEIPLVDAQGRHVWKHDASISIKALDLIGKHVEIRAFNNDAQVTIKNQSDEIDYSLYTDDELEEIAKLEALVARGRKRTSVEDAEDEGE